MQDLIIMLKAFLVGCALIAFSMVCIQVIFVNPWCWA